MKDWWESEYGSGRTITYKSYIAMKFQRLYSKHQMFYSNVSRATRLGEQQSDEAEFDAIIEA